MLGSIPQAGAHGGNSVQLPDRFLTRWGPRGMTRRRRGFGNIRKLPSGNYQARYTGPDLQWHNAPHTFTNKLHAERWLLDEHDLISRDVWTAPGTRATKPRGVTVGEYINTIIVRRENRTRRPLAPTTADLYRKDYRLRIKDELGDLQLAQLTPGTVAVWWDSLPARTTTMNARAYALLASCMKDAVDDELIEQNPCRLKTAGKPKPAHRGEALTVAQVLAYLDAVPEHRRLPLMTAAWCGLRSGEVRGLRRRDVDLKGNVLHVEQAVTRVHTDAHHLAWRIAPPKTDAGRRTVAIPGIMVEPLRTWLKAQPTKDRDALLFPAGDGASPMGGTVLRNAHLKGCAAIHRPKLRLHDLRRTAATLAAQEGATTRELMRLLGHTTVNVAMIYQVPDDERDHERAARLNDEIEQARRPPR